ncbi:MAG: hypothetical protein ACRCWM_12210 [Sarcina sp.]
MEKKYDRFADLFFGFIFSGSISILWIIMMVLTSDIPIVISKLNIIGISLLFVVLTVIYVDYARRSRQNLINLIFLFLPLFFSIGNLSNIKHFSEVTPMYITNFICAVLPSLIFFIKLIKNTLCTIKNFKLKHN